MESGTPQLPSAIPLPTRSFASAIAWTGAAKWLGQLLSWASTLIVARLLAPEDYGLVGMATVYLGFVTMVSELGLGLAVIAKRELDHYQIAQLNTLAVMLGAVAFAISCAAAFPLARFFESEKLPPVIMVLSTAFLIESLRTIPQSLLQKELRFRYLALVQAVHTVLVALSMVLFASLGLGFWTLVFGNLLGSVLLTALMMAKRPIDFAWPKPNGLAGVFTFGRHIVVGRVASYVSSKVDLVVIGRVLGDTALGVYTVAATVASMPLDKVSSIVNQVATPYFSERQLDKPALRHLLLTITQVLALITFPAAFGMALVAEDFVLLALGEKWQDIIGPLQLLAGLAAFRSITTVLAPVVIVTGGTRLSMYTAILEALIMPFVFYTATNWGLEGVAAAWLIGYPLFSLPLYVRAFRRAEMSINRYLTSILPALNGSLIMAIAVLALKSSMPADWPLAGRFALELLVGGCAYCLATWLIYRKRLLDFYYEFRKLGQEKHLSGTRA